MAVFLIVPTDVSGVLAARVREHFPGDQHFELPLGQFFVVGSGTSKNVSDLLGITSDATLEGTPGGVPPRPPVNGVVVSAGGYWGRATNDTWEWLKTHWSNS